MKYLHPYGRGNLANLDSLRYKYGSFASSKSSDTVFRTHIDLVSTTPPKMSAFTKLQDSDHHTQKYLALADAEIVFTCDGETCRKDVEQGAIVLCEHRDGVWILQVPGAGAWAKPYSGSACERSVDARADAMLARDLARSSAAVDKSQDRI